MAQTLELMQANALLLRGTEGEVVADARRMPPMDGFLQGQRMALEAAQTGTLASLPDLPKAMDAATTAAYIEAVLAGRQAVPAPIARQVEHILQLTKKMNSAS
jgi:anthranilate phosphoribosyltransferase